MTGKDELAQDMAIVKRVAGSVMARASGQGMCLDDLIEIGLLVIVKERKRGQPYHGYDLAKKVHDRLRRAIGQWARHNYRYGSEYATGKDEATVGHFRAGSLNPKPDLLSYCDREALGLTQALLYAQISSHHPWHEQYEIARLANRRRVADYRDSRIKLRRAA